MPTLRTIAVWIRENVIYNVIYGPERDPGCAFDECDGDPADGSYEGFCSPRCESHYWTNATIW